MPAGLPNLSRNDAPDPGDLGRAGPLVLFDGVCNFCNRLVNFVIDRDPAGRVRFAPLQSELGQRLAAALGIPTDRLETMVLIEPGRWSTHSTAALRLLGWLRWPWPLARALLVVPPPIRNLVYGLVARNRYRWFGKSERCRVPSPELQERFLA